MNIHIFGHSICLRSKKTFKTFTQTLIDTYNLQPHQLHISVCGSEERILYFLKKIKEPIDIVIIFHGDPGLMFVPTLERDLHPSTENEYFLDTPMYQNIKYFRNVTLDKSAVEEKFAPLSDFKRAYDYFLKYFYTRDLTANRHYGALIQIDQYLASKKINAIHCVLERTIPTWYTMTSGIVDTEITLMQKAESPYACDHRLSPNRINEEGNDIIARKLMWYIQSMARPIGLEPT